MAKCKNGFCKASNPTYVLMEVRDSKVFYVIDLKSAYHQIIIAEEDKEETTCVTQDYKFQWKSMSLGLTEAAPTLAAVMHLVLHDCRPYYYSFQFRPSNFVQLKKFLTVLAKYGILIYLHKSKFVKTSVVFLGHFIKERGQKNLVFKILANS